MIKVGTLKNAKPKIDYLKMLLKLAGGGGDFIFKAGSPQRKVEFPIGDKVTLTVSVPLRIEYQINAGVLTLKFRDPLPTVQYRMFHKDVTFVEITPERVDIGLDWSPDVYLEIES